jgi:hypothetical protein
LSTHLVSKAEIGLFPKLTPFEATYFQQKTSNESKIALNNPGPCLTMLCKNISDYLVARIIREITHD